MTRKAKAEYLIEYQVVGQSVKVSAVDPITLTEVSIVGPLSAGRTELKRNAVRKLEYVLDKKAGSETKGRRRPGRWV